MQNFDPKVAASVWQRVQAANEGKCTDGPACPVAGIPVVQAVWEEQEVKRSHNRQVRHRVQHCQQPGIPLPVLVYVLTRLLW